MGKKKHSYNLFDEYSEEQLNAFFDGVPQTELPEKAKKVKEDWRTDKQDPKAIKLVRRGGYVFDAVAVISGFLSYYSNVAGGVFFAISLACWVGALTLCAALPQYFTPLHRKTRLNMGYTSYAKDMQFVLIFLPLTMALSSLRWVTVLNGKGYLILGAIGVSAAVILCMVMHRLCEDFKRHFSAVVLAFAFSAFAFFGIAGYLNHYANFDKSYIPCTVTKLTETDDTYYCTIKTTDGKQAKLSISRAKYQSLKEGDTIRAYIGTGALGVEYACVEDN